MSLLASIPASELKRALQDRHEEMAILDVGEEGEFGEGHLLRASHAPFSLLESCVPTLVPRRQTRVVLVDHGSGIAARAAERLAAMGYTRLQVLEGGCKAWADAGYELFNGSYVPSKAYGEWLADRLETPQIDAATLKALRTESADKIVVLDPRTQAEHAARHVPGSVACPGAELAYRVDDLAGRDTTLVVVACGGRTRGLVGAQTLIDAGIPYPVAALADGNHGWQLAGFSLEEGTGADLSPVTPETRTLAVDRARALRQAYRIARVDDRTLSQWQLDGTRTTCILDVRTRPEFDAHHRPGSIHAAGGQLLQATDRWVAVRGARLVLVDDEGVRATSVAVHLQRMGWDVSVFELANVPTPHAATDTPRWAAGSLAADRAARVDTPRVAVDAVSYTHLTLPTTPYV